MLESGGSSKSSLPQPLDYSYDFAPLHFMCLKSEVVHKQILYVCPVSTILIDISYYH